MSNELQKFIDQYTEQINATLFAVLEERKQLMPQTLYESMLYSLEAGGKRIRPLLVLATLEDLNIQSEGALKAAAAIELIHTYSLIHDDLPSMDDDDLRRGKPTNHKVFGEAMAILAGDAMQTLAFELLTELPETDARTCLELSKLLAIASGANGMVGGQVLDIEGEGQSLTLEQLQLIHKNKTGALLTCSIQFGAVLANLEDEKMQAIENYAHHIGIAFQIQDDILDVTATTEQLGKNAGSDLTSDKTTYPMLLGLEQAKEQLSYHHEEANQSLAFLNKEGPLLALFANYIVNRAF